MSKGALAVNNTVSTASGVGSGNVNITDTGTGAALGGTGYIGTVGDASNVTLTGGRLYPGDLAGTTAAGNLVTSVGTLTIHGDLTFDALSSLNIDMNHSAADKVIADGAITLASAGLNFNLGTPDLDGSETFTLIDKGSRNIGGVFGALNGVAGDYSEGMPVVLGSQTYHITYAGGTGNDVVLLGTSVGLPGDYNNNGFVDAADYVLWRKGGPLANEVDNAGVVNAQDYTEWQARFGNSNPGSGSSLRPAAVP